MIGRILFGLTCAMAISLGARAQSGWQELAASEDWMHDFTVLTMYGDAWGSATEPDLGGRSRARSQTADHVRSGARLWCLIPPPSGLAGA